MRHRPVDSAVDIINDLLIIFGDIILNINYNQSFIHMLLLSSYRMPVIQVSDNKHIRLFKLHKASDWPAAEGLTYNPPSASSAQYIPCLLYTSKAYYGSISGYAGALLDF